MLQGQEAYGQISTEKNSFSAGEKQNINSAKEIEAQGQDKTIKETASEIGANKQPQNKKKMNKKMPKVMEKLMGFALTPLEIF